MTRLGSAAFVDLDETLLFSCYYRGADRRRRDDDEKVYYDSARGRNDYRFGDIVGYKRPHAADLLRFLHDRFDHLFVFTAGNEAYAEAMVDTMFDGLPFRPKIVFDRSSCVEETENTAFMEYWRKYTKDLGTLPFGTHSVDLNDSILIDDLANNGRHNSGQALLIPKFAYDASFEDDDWLLRVKRYLERAKKTSAAASGMKQKEPAWSDVDKSLWFLESVQSRS